MASWVIGRTIKKRREQNKLTQEQLGERTRLGRDAIKRLELGDTLDQNLATMRTVAAALGYEFPAFLRTAGVVDSVPVTLEADPGLRALVRDPDELTPEERDLVESVIRTLARRKENSGVGQ